MSRIDPASIKPHRPSTTVDRVQAGLKRRYRAERRFKALGIAAVGCAVLFLAVMFATIIRDGSSAFRQTTLLLSVYFDPEEITLEAFESANYQGFIKKALQREFPQVKSRQDKRLLYSLVSNGAGFQLRNMAQNDPSLIGQTIAVRIMADDDVDIWFKGRSAGEESGRLQEKQQQWLETLAERGVLELHFNQSFFQTGDSREPEQAGIWGAVVGSFYTLMITFLVSFPIGTATAVYLQEYAPKNRLTDIIEVNINNLAAVPSIVFGLLGLSVFLNVFGMPRSAPLVGGLVLSLMTLPTIIISGRVALQSVPPSIRDAALGLGASKMQTIAHHVLPLAMPGMLTGTIIGMARALGETAPLLMIGMVAFIVDIPSGMTDPSTALPVQIYLWADSPERAFTAKTSAAIMVLLGFLILMNGVAVFLRNRFERRW